MRKVVFAVTAGFAIVAISACGRTSLDTSYIPVPTSVAGMLTATPAPEIMIDAAATTEITAEAVPDAETAVTAEAQAAALTVDGDAAAGQVLFNQLIAETGFSCVACHNVASEDRLVGPGLLNVAAHAAARVPGQDVVTYLYNSIAHPNEYVVEGYPASLMPQVYGEILTEQQINDLVAYLLTLES